MKFKTLILKCVHITIVISLILSSCKKDYDDYEEVELIPLYPNSLMDGDGNIYDTVRINNQIWFTENLKTTTLNSGDIIYFVSTLDIWHKISGPAYCYYGNKSEYSEVYGLLYNWYAASHPNLCPDGWRVPTREDWIELKDYLDPFPNSSYNYAACKLKSKRSHPQPHPRWDSINVCAADSYGFKALPSGNTGFFYGVEHIGVRGEWWATTETFNDMAFYVSMVYNCATLEFKNSGKNNGLAIRCMRSVNEN